MKTMDIVTLGSLCVDFVLSVPRLPRVSDEGERAAFFEQLVVAPPDKKFWEAGANCNLAIAASRLGLRVSSIGHVGNDAYGHFLLEALHGEGVNAVPMEGNSDETDRGALCGTRLCWVLVDPHRNHEFFSDTDSGEEPVLSRVTELPRRAVAEIQRSKILFCDGYVFDEVPPGSIISALSCAVDAGAAIFFDPGPAGKDLVAGAAAQKNALEMSLRLADVLLLTSDEAESLTGIKNAVLAGRELIKKGERAKWVIIKMGSKGSILVTKSSVSCAPSFNVDVVDTVGCGDSCAAAVALGYLHDMSEIRTLALANAVGAATAASVGAGRNVATLDGVLGVLRDSNLNEDDEFWRELFEGNLEGGEVYLLSARKPVGGGGDDRFVHVPARNVGHQLICKLEEEDVCEKRVL